MGNGALAIGPPATAPILDSTIATGCIFSADRRFWGIADTEQAWALNESVAHDPNRAYWTRIDTICT